MIAENKILTFPVAEAGTLYVLPTDRFKVSTLTAQVIIPAEPEKNSLRRLMLSVLFRGCDGYPTQKHLNRRLDELYSAGLSTRFSRLSGRFLMGFGADFLDASYLSDDTDPFLGMLDLGERLLFHPVAEGDGYLSGTYLESEKQIVSDMIRSENKNAKRYAMRRLSELMHPGDPSVGPALGTEEQVLATTPEAITEEYHALLGNGTGYAFDFIYTGSADPRWVAEKLTDRFEGYRSGNRCGLLPCHGSPAGASVRRAEEGMPVGEGWLAMGFRTGIFYADADFHAAEVFNELFGASPVSRLFLNVRERKSICYSCASGCNFYRGELSVLCGLKNENREAAEAEIYIQLEDLKKGNFTDGELETAKRSLLHVYRQVPDHPSGLEQYYYVRRLFGLRESLDEAMEKIRAVTREQLIAVANRVCPDTVFFLRGDGNGEDFEDE